MFNKFRRKGRGQELIAPELVDANTEITANLSHDRNMDRRTRRILMLGSGASGKSTLLRQMKHLYINNRAEYPSDDADKNRETVILNLVRIINTLCQQIEKYQTLTVSPDVEHLRLEIAELKLDIEEVELSHELSETLSTLWADEAIKETFERRDEYTIMDNSAYFLESIDRITDPEYIPSFQDVIHTRQRTTGIIREDFFFLNESNHKRERYVICDVGGQRSERKKWAFLFEDVLAVIFVCALSGYDQVLYEDHHKNRLRESFDLFEDTFLRPAFSRTSVIIFLNKKDIFDEKIGRIPFSENGEFPDFEGHPHDPDDVIAFIRGQLGIRNHRRKRTLYFHVTLATDSDNVDMVFSAVHDTLVKNALRDGGLF